MENQPKTLKSCKQQSGAWTPAQGGGLGAGSTRGDPGKGWRGPCPHGEPPAVLPPPPAWPAMLGIPPGRHSSRQLFPFKEPGCSPNRPAPCSLRPDGGTVPVPIPSLSPFPSPFQSLSPFPSHSPSLSPFPSPGSHPAPTTTRPPRPHTGGKSLSKARLGAGGANPPPVSAPRSPLQVLGGSGRSPRDARPGDGCWEPLGGRFGVQPGTLSSSLCPSPVCVSQALNFFS